MPRVFCLFLLESDVCENSEKDNEDIFIPLETTHPKVPSSGFHTPQEILISVCVILTQAKHFLLNICMLKYAVPLTLMNLSLLCSECGLDAACLIKVNPAPSGKRRGFAQSLTTFSRETILHRNKRVSGKTCLNRPFCYPRLVWNTSEVYS